MSAALRRLHQPVVVLALALGLAACGPDAPTGAAGLEADAGDADRVVEVEMRDDLTYDPDTMTVQVDDVITFELTNVGETRHELVLGDRAEQADHASSMATEMHGDMAGMDHGGGPADGAVSLGAGESGSVTWEFTRAGTYQYACHEPGHFEGGMIGTIVVEG